MPEKTVATKAPAMTLRVVASKGKMNSMMDLAIVIILTLLIQNSFAADEDLGHASLEKSFVSHVAWRSQRNGRFDIGYRA